MKPQKQEKRFMIKKVTKTEFVTGDGVVHPIPFPLDEVPTVEEFQKIYDDWLKIFKEKGLVAEKESNE